LRILNLITARTAAIIVSSRISVYALKCCSVANAPLIRLGCPAAASVVVVVAGAVVVVDAVVEVVVIIVVVGAGQSLGQTALFSHGWQTPSTTHGWYCM